MTTLRLILWISLSIVFYSYLGYGIFLFIIHRLRSWYFKEETVFKNDFEPDVSLVIAAFNEASIIEEKILNSLELDYPKDKLKIIFVTDGSNDRSPEKIKAFNQRVEVLHTPERMGKVAAVNRAMQFVTTPFVVFSDCNTYINTQAIKEIVKHYQDENIGAVAGEKKIMSNDANTDAVSAGEGLYWKYESFLKRMDSEFYTVVGAAGELFSLRTKLFESLPLNILLDDFIISMKICQKGYRVIYEPNAFASEHPSFSMKDEQKRKIRISAGGLQSVVLLKDLLNIFKYGKLSFQYISHRVLRWIVCPILLPLIFIINLFLTIKTGEKIYFELLFLQIAFVLMAVLGWQLASRNIKIKTLYIPYYFMFMNLSLYLGIKRYLNKSQSVLWEKATRKN